MEKENSLCSKVLNNLKWGSTALLEDIEQDGVEVKGKKELWESWPGFCFDGWI